MKATTFVTWEDVPHLSESQKEQILAGVPPWQRDARSKGVPALGEGAIFQVPESDFVVSPMTIPEHWPRGYGLDVGWRMNAAIFGAWDRENDTVYLYDEVYKGKTDPIIVASAIKSRGEWLKGVIDPASRGRAATDGRALMDVYKDLGLDVRDADNAVEAGITLMWQRLSEGRLKVFRTLQNWLAEYRIYRRDKSGKPVKKNDHALDASRYFLMSGLVRAEPAPGADPAGQWWDKWQSQTPTVFAG